MTTNTKTRPLGVAHLIFGLIFTGIAAIWLIGEANNTDIPDLAVGFPAVLIGAGIVGLAATLVNQRRAKALQAEQTAAVTAEPTPEPADEYVDDTTTLTIDKDES